MKEEKYNEKLGDTSKKCREKRSVLVSNDAKIFVSSLITNWNVMNSVHFAKITNNGLGSNE